MVVASLVLSTRVGVRLLLVCICIVWILLILASSIRISYAYDELIMEQNGDSGSIAK